MSAEDHRPMTDEPLRTTCLVCGVEQISTPITPPEWVTLPAAEFDTWKVAVKWLIEAAELVRDAFDAYPDPQAIPVPAKHVLAVALADPAIVRMRGENSDE